MATVRVHTFPIVGLVRVSLRVKSSRGGTSKSSCVSYDMIPQNAKYDGTIDRWTWRDATSTRKIKGTLITPAKLRCVVVKVAVSSGIGHRGYTARCMAKRLRADGLYWRRREVEWPGLEGQANAWTGGHCSPQLPCIFRINGTQVSS